MINKNTGISIGLLIPLIGGFLWIGNKADKVEVEKVEEKVEEVEDVNMEQTYILKSAAEALERVNKRIDKLEE